MPIRVPVINGQKHQRQSRIKTPLHFRLNIIKFTTFSLKNTGLKWLIIIANLHFHWCIRVGTQTRITHVCPITLDSEMCLNYSNSKQFGKFSTVQNSRISSLNWLQKFKDNFYTVLPSDGTIWPWGKTMDTIRYCTKYRDTIRYNTVPKCCAVCQQSKINVAFSLTPSHAFASCLTTPSTVVDDIRPLSIISGRVWTWGRYGIKNLALIDFSSVQTDAVNWGRSHTIERRSRRANVSTCSQYC